MIVNLRKIRRDRDYSQTELALLCDTTQNTISSIERCEYGCSVRLALKLSRALHCDVNDIFKLDDSD